MNAAEVKVVIGAVLPAGDAEAEQVEVGRENNRGQTRDSSGLLLLPGPLYRSNKQKLTNISVTAPA